MSETMIEGSQALYFGKYRGFVVDNKDPEARGRLRLCVPSLFGEATTDWADPCLPFGGLGDQGLFLVPEAEAQVWVEFESGNASFPIWTGTFWQKTTRVPAEAVKTTPTTRILKTPSGHLLQFDDEADSEALTLAHTKGAALSIDKNGTLTVQNANKEKVTLEAESGKVIIEDGNGSNITLSSNGINVKDGNGNKIDLTASGVTVEGQTVIVNASQVTLGGKAGEPLIKGQSFLTKFMTHTHPGAGGMSGPPIPQGELSALSTKVMTG